MADYIMRVSIQLEKNKGEKENERRTILIEQLYRDRQLIGR